MKIFQSLPFAFADIRPPSATRHASRLPFLQSNASLRLAGLAVLLALAPIPALTASVDDIISKARAHVGAETSLDRVTSIRFTGTIEAEGGNNGAIEIIFQKPDQQRIVVTMGAIRETTCLNSYDGWLKREEVAAPDRWQLTLLDAAQIRRLQANTWENLHFFRGLEKRSGRVEHQGTATIDGVLCDKVAFIHRADIIFTRYFDQNTGRLVRTETEQGGVIREEGEIRVDGIRFPRRILTTINDQTSVITFERIELNRKFEEDLFAIPNLVP